MHLFYDIMLYQQFFVLFISKSHPHISIYLAEFKKYAKCHKNPLQTHGIPQTCLFFLPIMHFEISEQKHIANSLPLPTEKNPSIFSQGVFVSIETFFPSLQRVQNGGIHVAGDNGTIQPIPFSFEPTGKNRMQQSKNC